MLCRNIIITLCIICAIVVLLYSDNIDLIIGANTRDTSKPQIKIGTAIIGMWTFTHFIFFFILGIICPNNILLIILLGVLWELLEFYLEYDNQILGSEALCKYVNRCGMSKKINSKRFFRLYSGLSNDKYRSLYYCSGGLMGQLSDIISNIIGYLLGSLLHRIMTRIK